MSYYATGTASVLNGATTVTFTGALLGSAEQPNLKPGDVFFAPDQAAIPGQRLASFDYVAGTAELWAPWPGTDLEDDAYEVRLTDDGVRAAASVHRYIELLARLVALGIQPNGFGEGADRDAFDGEAEGFIFLDLGTPWTLYSKLSATDGDWSDGQPIEGAAGDPGERGWSPAYALMVDGDRRVKQLVGYVGSEGAEPTANVGDYLGPLGYVADIEDATDERGGTGAAGVDGADPGILLNWDVANDDSDPGTGKIKADNDALGSATLLYVDKANRAGSDIEAFLADLDDSTSPNKGTLTLTDPVSGAQAIWSVTGVTDETGYVKVAISGHSGATGFADALPVSLQFSRTGNAGAGTGDVVGPAGAVNNRAAAFDGTTGKLIKDSGIILGTAAAAALDTDNTLAADADDRVASQKAVKAFVAVALDALVAAAPGTLDTLNELAAALGDDPNFATTIATALGGKQPLDSDLTAIAGLTTDSYGRGLLELVGQADLAAELPVDFVANLGMAFSVGSSALTARIKQRDGATDPTAASPVTIAMPNGAGAYSLRAVASALSLVVSSGSTLGHPNVASMSCALYWYLIDNAGTLELAVSYSYFGHEGIVSTTAEGGAGAADSGTVMYSATARASVPFRCIGFTKDAQATAGTWANVPTTVKVGARIEREKVAFHANKGSTDQTGIVTATQTLITFTNEVFDIGGYYDAANSLWYPPPGQVRVSAQARLTAGVVDQAEVSAIVRKGGGSNLQTTGAASGTGNQATFVNALYEVNGNQGIDVLLYATGTGNKTVSGNNSYSFFQGESL